MYIVLIVSCHDSCVNCPGTPNARSKAYFRPATPAGALAMTFPQLPSPPCLFSGNGTPTAAQLRRPLGRSHPASDTVPEPPHSDCSTEEAELHPGSGMRPSFCFMGTAGRGLGQMCSKLHQPRVGGRVLSPSPFYLFI